MKKQQNYQSVLLNSKCNYNHFISAEKNLPFLVYLLRSCQKLNNLSYPYIIKEGILGKGTKFILKRPDLDLIIFYEVIEILITDYYSRFKYQIYKTIPETFNFITLIEIRYINEFQCDIRYSNIYDNKIIIPEREFQHIIKLKKRIYRDIEINLKNFIVRKLSIVSTVINSDIELIWNILRNMKMVHKYIKLLGYKVNFNGEVIKKDDIIEVLKFKNNNQFKSIAKVNKCKITKKGLTKEFIIELLFKNDIQNYNSRISKIIMQVNEFQGKCSMYIFYFFEDIQDYNSISQFKIMENIELNKFKKIIENYKKFSNNQDLKNK